MQAFILAGGFATRLWPLTEKRAKPLLPLAGKPIISHPLEQLPEDLPVTVSTNAAFAEGFQDWQRALNRPNVEIAVEHTRSDDEKLGALGALAQWITERQVDDDILLLTGDNYFGFHIPHFLEHYTPGTPLLAAFDIGDHDQARAFGTVILHPDKQRIAAFEEKPKAPKTTLVSTGCSILPAAALPVLISHAKEYPDNVGGIFEELKQQDWDIHCYTFSEPWFDVGSFQAYLDATKTLVGEQLILGQDAVCEGTQCTGSVVIGPRSRVQNCILKNVVIFEDCELHDCELEDCIVDNHTVLKGIDLRGKMLREGTKLVKQ